MNTQINTAADADDMSELLASLQAAEEAEQQVEETIDDDFDEAALLADLGAITAATAEPEVEPIEVQSYAELEEELLADIVNAAQRVESYEKQVDTAPVIDPADAAAMTATVAAKSAAEKAPKAAKAPKAPKALKAPKTPRVAFADLPDEAFVIVTGGPSMKADVLASIPAQVKVAEKFENLFTQLHAGKEPSRYVVSAFKLLNAQKKLTSTDIVTAYKTEGLGDGTARSQSGQIMALFAATGIAVRSGQSLELRADSELAAKLRKVLGL